MRGVTDDLRWGVIFSFSGFLWMCLEYALGLHTTRIDLHPVVTNLYAPIAITIMTLAIRDHRDADGNLSWADGLRAGMTVSAVTSLLAAPSLWLFLRYVNPRFFSRMIAYAAAHGRPLAEARAYFNFRSYAIESTVGPLVMGLITSVIVVAVLRALARRRHAAAAIAATAT
jgi:hypothetical protein